MRKEILYKSTADNENHGVPTIRCIWPIGYKENPTCMQARAEIMYRKLKLTKLISAIIQEREKQPSLFMGISLLENKHGLWGEYINVWWTLTSPKVSIFPTKEITVIRRLRLGFPRLLKTWCTMLSSPPDKTGHGGKASVNISIRHNWN